MRLFGAFIFAHFLGIISSRNTKNNPSGECDSAVVEKLREHIRQLETDLHQCLAGNNSANAISKGKASNKFENLQQAANIMGLETSIFSMGNHHSNSKKKKEKTAISLPLVQITAEPHEHASAPDPISKEKKSIEKQEVKNLDGLVESGAPSARAIKLQRVKEIVSQIQATAKPTNKEQLFYMYELEEEFWWRWPKVGTDCSANGYVGHEHAVLSGMGTPISGEEGLYLTWHFSLFSSLFNRLKRSRRRTFDPEKASLFIIPYDLGLDGYLNQQNCQNSRQCSRGLPLKLQGLLEQSKYWHRHNGADHAVLWSLGQYHPWPRNGCDLFMRDFCRLCTFTCYWMDSTKPESRFVSVPFPSAYHWRDGILDVPWDNAAAASRNLTAVYLGSTQTLNPAHTKIRRAMTAQCSASASCHWLQIGHNSKDNSIADYLRVYKRAVFCLCPPGDDPARKAVFDAIISGCIPVIFQKETLYNQYPWHIGESAALDISVSIPGAMVRSGKLDFMSVLLGLSPETIRKKQAALMQIAPRVQYAIPPDEYLVDRHDSTPWDPPFPDGVDITLDGLFDRVGHVLRNESTGLPPSVMLQKAWHQRYDVVIVQIPSGNNNSDLADSDSTSSGASAGVSGQFARPKRNHHNRARQGAQD